VRVGLISDTHGKLRPGVFEAFSAVDVILHAGDIGSLDIITELEVIAPVHAVHGNTDDFDVMARYGEIANVELEGKHVVVVHGHLLGSPTPERLRGAFPDADVIVYGHTHKAMANHTAPMIVNPGAAGPARFKLKPSVAILEIPAMSITFVEL
jgi:uncharacterized protein